MTITIVIGNRTMDDFLSRDIRLAEQGIWTGKNKNKLRIVRKELLLRERDRISGEYRFPRQLLRKISQAEALEVDLKVLDLASDFYLKDPVNINVYPSSLITPVYLKRLQEYQFKKLTLELIEKQAIDAEKIARVIPYLKELKIKLALDDFGTGSANFDVLFNLPFSRVKVDRMFLDLKDSSSALLHLLLPIKAQSATAILEGIETQQHLEMAWAVGYRFFQGWHFDEATVKSQKSNVIHTKKNNS